MYTLILEKDFCARVRIGERKKSIFYTKIILILHAYMVKGGFKIPLKETGTTAEFD